MLEQLDSPSATHGGENAAAESISRKDADLAYLAAMIDGEGCVYAGFRNNVTDNNLTVRVTVYNTHPFIIRRVTEILCKYDVHFYMSMAKDSGKSKPGVTITVGGKGRVKKLLGLIMPYLTAKRKRAELALELIAYREELALQYGGRSRDQKWVGVSFQKEPRIKQLVDAIRDEVHNYPSVVDFSRVANRPFGESSETLRLPGSDVAA